MFAVICKDEPPTRHKYALIRVTLLKAITRNIKQPSWYEKKNLSEKYVRDFSYPTKHMSLKTPIVIHVLFVSNILQRSIKMGLVDIIRA